MKFRYFHHQLILASILAFAVESSLGGSIWRFVYDGDSTSSDPTQYRQSVSTLTNFWGFPGGYGVGYPDFGEQLDDYRAASSTGPVVPGLQGKDNSGADYGSWIRGYLEAPATGSYRLGIASADNSELYLSTDEQEEKATLIAYEPGTGEVLFSGNRLETRISAPIPLVQGTKYYLEIRQQHGGGNGYIQVGWQRPDGVQEIIPALHLAQYEDNLYTGTSVRGQPPAFNRSSQFPPGGYNGGDISTNVTLQEGAELLLPLDVLAQQPTTFVWTINGVAVPGQNLSYFDVPQVPATFDGLRIQAIVSNAFGSLTSSVTTVKVIADTTPPAILTVDTAGDPNLVEIIFSKPVSSSATNLANFSVKTSDGFALSITNVSLSGDLSTVFLNGSFNFSTASNYVLTAQNITDRTAAGNELTPSPSVVSFTLTAPLGAVYNFDSGTPSDFRFYGNAGITNNALAASGGGILRLTDAARTQNGAVLLTTRHNIDQVHIKFKTRISDGGSSAGAGDAGDGFSVNISPNLPLGTFSSPQFGYSPAVPGNQLSIFFNTHWNSEQQPIAVGVSLNSVVLTNIVAGTNGIAFNGVPSITSVDGHWAPVDINIHRDGTLDLAYDGVALLTSYPTPWVGINSGEIGFAAATRTWHETHWLDDLYINYGEGDVGNAGLADSSVLGGTFLENSLVKLIAVPTGAGPFSYQWYKNGNPLAGATDRILSFSGVLGAGGHFAVAVSNAFSGFVSGGSDVIIQPDRVPPTVLSVRDVAGGVNEILLAFNKPLDPASATAVSTYSSPYFVVNAASLSGDGKHLVLTTTQQRVGTTYTLSIAGLKDTTAAANILVTNLSFVANLTYQDEVLADNPARYFKLDEANGTVAATQTAIGDTVNTNGTYNNLPILGFPSLVPSASSNEFAVGFVAANTNWILVPNGGDVNDFRGPWAKKSYELWFNAASLPIGAQPGDTAVQAQNHALRGLWEEGGNLRSIGLYLWNSVTNDVANTNSPGTALLTFHAYNSTADGPGSPFGLLTYPATYVTYPITTNVTYHVVAVLDGDANGTNGGLRLHVNGLLVDQLTNGVGQIYNHNGDVEIGQGNARSHLNVNGVWGSFDGIIDEVSTYNKVLSSNRIVAHYLAGTGASTSPSITPTVVAGVDTGGNPDRLDVIFNQPVSSASATNLSNYALKAGDNTSLSISSAELGSDLKTVRLSGPFGFVVSNNYNVTVSGVADILAATNIVATTNLAFTFASQGPVGISPSSSLASQIITENQSAVFAVVATGQAPYRYQWLYNGAPIAGQTNAALGFSAQWNSTGDYSVVVANEFTAITSSPPSKLTVLADVAPPRLVGLRGLAGTLNQIVLNFDEPLDASTATNLSYYSVLPGGGSLSLLRATVSSNGLQVVLTTSPQVNGQTYQLTLRDLKDRAHVPNALTVSAQFASGISYRDEILSEGAVRYWTFDETSGTVFRSLVSKYDTEPLNVLGTINDHPRLGVPGLVPNVPNNTAFAFSKSSTNDSVDLPNGKDINAILGPWTTVTHIFSFKADSLPRAFGATNAEAPAIYGHSAVVFYLYGTQDTDNPTQALLVFKANNTSSDGPGSPWGGNSPAVAKYITYPVSAGQTYHVVGILDGNASFTGQLRLYIDGKLVGTVTGIGEIYKHPNTPPAFAHSYFNSVYGTNYTIRPDLVVGSTLWADRFDGVIDEAALINSSLGSDRISQLYAFSQTNAPNTGFTVLPDAPGTGPSLSFASSAGQLSLSWPTDAAGYYLEYSTNLASGIWLSNPVPAYILGGFNTVTQAPGSGDLFFRLHHP